MTLSFLCLYLCSFILSTTATNDWNKPCFSGVCEYDLPSTNGRSSGTLTIWGSHNSIGDITPAGGWAILTCSPEAVKQPIRIACMDEGSPSCAHLFGNTTNLNHAVGRVVRLPETCGKNAFGIVTKATLDDDQSIPVNMVRSLSRRDGTLPTVHGLHISTNLDAAEHRAVGEHVYFSIRAANIPGSAGNSPIHSPQDEASIKGRGLSSSVKDTIDELKSLTDSDYHANGTLQPKDINQNFTVIDQNISCPYNRAGISIHVDTKSHAFMTLGVAANGTITPPKINSISITGNITANIDAIVNMTGNVAGTLDLAEIKLFEIGLPLAGINIPGILSVGPSFAIAAKATASLDAEVDMQIGINYDINQTTFTFPEQNGPAGGSFKRLDTFLKVNANPRVNATGTVSVHLIPSLNFGIDAFVDKVNTKVFVEIDTSVSAMLGITTKEQTKDLPRDEPIPSRRPSQNGDLENDPSVVARADAPPVSLDGCFEAGTGIIVNVGAVSDFFDLFNAATEIQLYNQTFQLFEKCFASTLPKRSSPPISYRELDSHREMRKKRAINLQCLPLSSGSQSPIIIVDETIPGSNATMAINPC